MNINTDLIENVTLLTPKDFILRYDGTFRLKLTGDSKRAYNNTLIPKSDEDWQSLNKSIITLMRYKIATLSNKYLLTPNDKFVLNNEKTRKTIQKGGYFIEDGNISKPGKRKRRRKSKQEERAAKRQKLIEDNKRKWEADVELQRKKRKIEEILERVNAEYRLRIETDFGDYSQYHMVTGILRNVPKLLVPGLVALRGDTLGIAQSNLEAESSNPSLYHLITCLSF
jgi:hypothetical protein